MPYPSETYTNQIQDPFAQAEFRSLYSLFQGYLSNQHKDDGSHGAITVDSVTEAGRIAAMGYWLNWTPAFTNLSVGNGTVIARYTRVGKTVRVYVSVTLGSTSTVGTGPTVSLPVTASANEVGLPVGNGEAVQTGTAAFGILTRLGSSTVALPLVQNLTGGYVSQAQITATVPFTWASTHLLNLSFAYEMA